MRLEERLAVVGRLRGLIAERPQELANTVPRDISETLVSEILPLAEACLFLEREAAALLAPKRMEEGRPFWLPGVELEIHREPLGVILVIGPANYPLFLPAVQILQAWVAGNTVIVKPGVGGSAAMGVFANLLRIAGLPEGSLQVLGESPDEATAAIESGVDKVFLTGSHSTGQAVLSALSETVTPSVMELSGCDPVFVRDDADLDLVARSLRFGRTLNGGDTCIAPQRVFVARTQAANLLDKIRDLRIPVSVVDTDEEALEKAAACGYALGASVFGGERGAKALATRIRAGVVVINDMIVPTADPRLPFGGRGKSGFGITRGAEGLLEMTAVKAISTRRGRWRPHLDASHTADAELFEGFLALLHGGNVRARLKGFTRMSRAAWARRKGVVT